MARGALKAQAFPLEAPAWWCDLGAWRRPVGIKPGRNYPRAPDWEGAIRPFAGEHGGTIDHN
jgi:hypothetical protein